MVRALALARVLALFAAGVAAGLLGAAPFLPYRPAPSFDARRE